MSTEVTYKQIPPGAYINRCMATFPHAGIRCHRAAEVIQETVKVTPADLVKKTKEAKEVVEMHLCRYHAAEEQQKAAKQQQEKK